MYRKKAPSKAPLRKIIGIHRHESLTNATLECGHRKWIRYGQKRTRCEKCLQKCCDSIKEVPRRVAVRIQSKIKLSTLKPIANQFSEISIVEDRISEGIGVMYDLWPHRLLPFLIPIERGIIGGRRRRRRRRRRRQRAPQSIEATNSQ